MSDVVKTYFEKAGAIIVRVNEGKPEVLLEYRGRNGFEDWSFPKGGMDEDETPEETAKREVKEETGLEIEIIKVLPTIFYSNEHDGEVRQYMFLAKPKSDCIIPETSLDKVEWTQFDKAVSKLTYRNLKEYFESIKEELEDNT